jgi:hypothetical protein
VKPKAAEGGTAAGTSNERQRETTAIELKIAEEEPILIG